MLLAFAVLSIHRQHASRVGRWGAAAAGVAATGAVTTGVVNAAEHCLHLPIGLAFVMGSLVTWVALVVFAVFVIRSGFFPRWMGFAWVATGSGLLLRERRLAHVW